MKQWEDYFYPGATVLINKLDIRDPAKLAAIEYVVTATRAQEIKTGAVDIPRTFDGEHLKALHGYLFGDLYEWAGQNREVNMSKDNKIFAPTQHIDDYLAQVSDSIHATQWEHLERSQFADHSAEVYTGINYSHPFREGNGRVAKLFMSQLAEKTSYDYNFGAINPDVWNRQSGLSRPGPADTSLHPEALTAVFEYITVERPTPPPPETATAEAALRAAMFAGRDHPTAPAQASSGLVSGRGPQSTSYRTPEHHRPNPTQDNGYDR
jgi:cell filamentation protein